MNFLSPQETSGVLTVRDNLSRISSRSLPKYGLYRPGGCRAIAIRVAPKAPQNVPKRPKTSIFAYFCPCKSRTPSIGDLGSSPPRRVLMRSFTWCNRILSNFNSLAKRTRFVPKKGQKVHFLSRNDWNFSFFLKLCKNETSGGLYLDGFEISGKFYVEMGGLTGCNSSGNTFCFFFISYPRNVHWFL